MILSPDKPNQETQAMEEITNRSEKAGKCRKRRRKWLSARGPNLVETAQNSTTSDHYHVCEELIIEIFTRLPAKSLLRFRSLSKSLYSCIGSPGFIRMHTSRSPQKLLIRHNDTGKRTNKDFYTLHLEDRLGLCHRRVYSGIKAVEFPFSTECECVGSCNGIFFVFDYKNYNLFLWNPSIRRKLIMPHCPTFYPYDPPGLGFGYDSITDDYKIVSLPIFGDFGASSYVYTLKTGVWCEIASPTPSFYEAKSRGCFVNGALHWVVQSTQAHDEVAHFYILTFNLSTHAFGKIVLPEPNWETKRLTTIQGSLAAISTKHDDDSWIWLMTEYNDPASWSVFFKSKTIQVKGRLERVLQPTSNGDLFFDTSCDEEFHVYDPKRRTQSRLQNLNAVSSIIDMETCVESLQLIEKGTACRGRLLSSYYSSRKFVKRSVS